MPKTTTTSGNMTITVDTTGLDRWLDQLGTRREDYLDAFAAKVEARAKTVAPVDTGNLKNSIHFWKPQEGVRRIGDGVEYGIYQELGTSRMGARPWLVPSFETEMATFTKGLKVLFE